MAEETGDVFIDSHVAFLYASQTGNAESISYNLYEEAVKRGFNASWHVLDDHEKFGFNDLRTIVFVVSTTGDGDPPDNSARFWRILRKATRTNPTAYSHLRLAILGLGDTNYSNFCNTAQRLDKQLLGAGATAFYPKGLADDGTDLEEVVEPWIEGLWPALARVAQCKGSGDKEDVGCDAVSGSAAGEVDVTTDALDRLAVTGSTTDTVVDSLDTPVFQPLLLDFRPMATLSAISGAPRAPSPVCTASYVDTGKAGEDYRSRIAAMNSSFICPPWYTELTSAENSTEDSLQTPFLATIISTKKMTTASALKRTLLVELELPDAVAVNMQGSWHAGDAFNIFAPNDEHLVAALIKRLDVDVHDADRPILLQKKDPKIDLPAHLQRFLLASATLRDILTWAVDLCSMPRKQFIRVLSGHCSEAADRDRLLYLCSRQGTRLLEDLRRQSPTVLDILHAFPSCALPYTRLIELLSPLVPRSYSICNAPRERPNLWRIAFNVVEYELEVVDPFASVEDSAEDDTIASSTTNGGVPTTSMRINRKGVCTPWLEKLSHTIDKQHILIAKRPNLNGFYLPPSSPHHGIDPRPVIMVGPGTGVAPFIGFLEQRADEIEKTHISVMHTLPSTWLFFGCRSSTDDYLFRDQIEHHLDRKVLSRLSLCFSRDPVAREKMGASKYVQDAMLKHSDEIADLMLNQNALLYVCGDAKGMGKDVNEAMAGIICRYLNEHPEQIEQIIGELPKSKLPADPDAKQMSRVQALQLLMHWSSQKRYVRDLWA
ncbi:hypothetical protein H4R24_001825 [Coemansia sp. RSA 988]|nr:hypothetical protein H4R24_001825 [Coemansia sp. RSA 988]